MLKMLKMQHNSLGDREFPDTLGAYSAPMAPPFLSGVFQDPWYKWWGRRKEGVGPLEWHIAEHGKGGRGNWEQGIREEEDKEGERGDAAREGGHAAAGKEQIAS